MFTNPWGIGPKEMVYLVYLMDNPRNGGSGGTPMTQETSKWGYNT